MNAPIRFSPEAAQLLRQSEAAARVMRDVVARWLAEHPQAREVAPGIYVDPSGECLEL